jgi:peptidoglycan/LPS O-acetylase OafA/YrhL
MRQAAALPEARFRPFDGLRGIAILLVLFHHFTGNSGALPRTAMERVYFALAEASWCGVDLFFVLSGFLITGILLRSKDGERYLRNFYLRRALRIFPAYYALLIAVFVVLPPFVPIDETFGALRDDQVWYWTYLTNVLYAREGWPPVSGVGHLWSLAVEEQFYLLWPLVVLVCGRRTLVHVCIVAAALSLLLRIDLVQRSHVTAAYVLMPAHMDALAIGALLAVVGEEPRWQSRLRPWAKRVAWWSAGLLAVIAIAARGLNAAHPYVLTAGVSAFALFFGAILVLVRVAPPASPVSCVLSGPVLTFFGRYSYGLYLTHSPLLRFLITQRFGGTAVQPVGGSVMAGVVLFSMIGVALSVGVSLVSWHVVERPFLRLKRFWPRYS